MNEVKIYALKERALQTPDVQDIETLETFANQPKVKFRIDRNEEEDEPILNPDGSISYVRTVNINGIQWQIPVEQETFLPESVYNVLKQSEDIKNRYRPKPINVVKIDLGYGM